MKRQPSTRWIPPLLLGWAILVGTGFVALERFQSLPGAPASAPASLKQSAKPTLWVFIHPGCGCSQATLSELAQLVATCGDRLATKVEIYDPGDMPREWVTGDRYQEAMKIKGVLVEMDKEGRVASSMGVHTSGQSLLYGADGHLAFSGGLTASRGHEGPSDGAEAITKFVTTGSVQPKGGSGRPNAVVKTPVFGCAIGATSTGPVAGATK